MSSINAYESKTRFIARFVPQAWQRDYAVECDAEGPRFFDVTAEVLGMDETERDDLGEGGNKLADRFRDLPQAPQWIREWRGPFEVYVEAYDAQQSGEKAVIEAKEAAKLVGPIICADLRAKLINQLTAHVVDSLRNQRDTLAEILRKGTKGYEGMTNAELLKEYAAAMSEDFLDANDLEINEFGDIRAA